MSDKYNQMENILQAINRDYIRLPREEIARNNVVLNKIIFELVEYMKEINPTFDQLYRTIYYGGSYYDGLKVGHPDKYNLDLLLVLPEIFEAEVATSNKPGYVHAILGYKGGLEFLCEPRTNYLDTEKILSWFQGLLARAVMRFSYQQDDIHIKIVSRSGPGFTLNIIGRIDDTVVLMDITLVPCIMFDEDSWPTGGYRKNPCENHDTFCIVPKSPKSVEYHSSRYWRLSFQAQEKRLIHGKEKLIPALKLIKKMKNTWTHPFGSYELKTIALWEVVEHPWNLSKEKSLSDVFMHILKLYKKKIMQGKIEYFWNKKLNLIDGYHSITYTDFGRQLENFIKKIENDPLKIASCILEREELEEFVKSQDVSYLALEPEPDSSCVIA